MAIKKYVINQGNTKHIIYSEIGKELDNRLVLFKGKDRFAVAEKFFGAKTEDKETSLYSSGGFVKIRIPAGRVLSYTTKDQEINVAPGEYLLVDSDGLHKMRSIGKGKSERRIQISISKEIFGRLLEFDNIDYSRKNVQFKVCKKKISKELKSMIDLLFYVLRKITLGKDIAVESSLNQIASYLLNNHPNDYKSDYKNAKKYKFDENAMKIVRYIQNNFNKKINLNDIAKDLFLNKYSIIRIFKKYIGMTPYEYLIKYRIVKAKKMLKNRNIKINTVSRQVGYSSLSQFNEVFKSLTGITPGEYRKLS